MAKKLTWNGTDADSIAASDFVGSVLHAGADALTSTLIDTAQCLDVNVANEIAIDLDGVYDAGDNPNPDNTGLIGHERVAAPDDTNQTIRTTAGALDADAVVAADVHGLDVASFGMVYNGTTWDRLKGTSGAVNIHDGGNSITVDAVNLDIRDLAAATDTVSAWTKDGSGNSINSTSNALHVNVQNATLTVSDAALSNTSIVVSAVACSDVQAALPTTAGRDYLDLYNNGQQEVYIGPTGVGTAGGFPIYPGVYRDYRAGAGIAIFGICKTGKTTDLRTLGLT